MIVDDDWVFRFPRRAGVEEALGLEIVLLPLLAPALPVKVPPFEHISRDPSFVGYRLIRGEPLVDEDADGLRAFLDALHAFDPSRLPVQHLEWVAAYREQCAEFEAGKRSQWRATQRVFARGPCRGALRRNPGAND